jgi:hypothetical protein
MGHGRLVSLLGAALVAAATGCGEDVRSAAAGT